MNHLRDRQLGIVYGLAIGDALGVAVEFCGRNSFPPVTGYRSGTFSLTPGEWTDDTQMALALAWSLKDGFSLARQLDNYLLWRAGDERFNYRPPFDMGGRTGSALSSWRANRSINLQDISSDGNGSIMRLGPLTAHYLPMVWDENGAVLDVAWSAFLDFCALSSVTTHPSVLCQTCCRVLGAACAFLASGGRLERDCWPVENLALSGAASPKVVEMWQRRRWDDGERDEISSSGYALDTLEAALWCVRHAETFEEAVLLAANLGNDSDSVGAVTGQLAGARWGIQGIPGHLLDGLKGIGLIDAAIEGVIL
jgi:ADP-ribosyl-[dinitrogen reductase] hydrolase